MSLQRPLAQPRIDAVEQAMKQRRRGAADEARDETTRPKSPVGAKKRFAATGADMGVH
jgi:hypothetical protein